MGGFSARKALNVVNNVEQVRNALRLVVLVGWTNRRRFLPSSFWLPVKPWNLAGLFDLRLRSRKYISWCVQLCRSGTLTDTWRPTSKRYALYISTISTMAELNAA